MASYFFLIPISLMLGFIGLLVFLWTLKSDQYDDLKGAAERVLDDPDRPIVPDDTTNLSAQLAVGPLGANREPIDDQSSSTFS